ncbi:MAG: hypothetical protein NUV98_01145 [Candidatus Roizmanbacteria bacterium]|nr:hypothetical protein [Candidatus Roizmanbacteria bacterium]
MKNTEGALRWIVEILERHNVPFQIGGGFAAHVYGSPREVADIDIAIPEEKFDVILPDIKGYLIFGPEHYVDKDWDLQLMTVLYQGQEIDFAGAYQKKFFNHARQEWFAFPSDFSTSEYRTVYGMKIPLMAREKLIGYKKMLSRGVDIEDLKALDRTV